MRQPPQPSTQIYRWREYLNSGLLEVTGQALYWRDMRPGNEVAVSTIAGEPSVPHFERPAHEWGGAIQVRYHLPCCIAYLSGRYIWYNQRTTSQITQPTLLSLFLPTLAAPALSQIDTRLDEEYRTATIDAGIRVGCSGRAKVLVFGRARYARLRSMSEEIHFLTAGGTFSSAQRWSLEGWGPGVGVEGVWQPFGCWILNGIALRAHLGGGVTIGRSKLAVAFPASIFSLVSSQNFPNNLGTFPNLDLRLSLSYTVGYGCFRFSIEGGYEANYYWNCFQRINNNPPIFGISTPETSSIGFGGPFVGGRLAF